MKEIKLVTEGHTTNILVGTNLVPGLEQYRDKGLILLVDENVLSLHKDLFASYDCITIPSGEKHKTLEFVTGLYRQLLDKEIDRSCILVGVGGGLTTDVAGFLASTYMRGISFGFISTTLLGQVDASIGGKNGVNLDGYKNMIGTIRQPEFIWCDLSLLETLEKKELVSGMAEVVKYGCIRDRELFKLIASKAGGLPALAEGDMEHIVMTSAGIKVKIVESDVTEKGDRKLLNFGHTLGHAIEKLTGMLHGEAVSIGMVLAARISVKLAYLEAGDADLIESALQNLGLPVKTEIPAGDIFDTLLKDKKRAGSNIHFILLRSIGEAFIHEMELSALKDIMHDLY